MRKFFTTIISLLVCFGLGIFATACALNFSTPTNTTTVTTEEAFNEAILAGKNVILGNDLEVSTITIAEGSTVKIDLSGKTLTTTLKQEGRHNYAIDNYGTLTLKGKGTIKARGIQNFGDLTVEDGVTIESIDANGGACIWNEGNLTVNGGTFKATYEGSASDVSGPGCINNSGTAIINGGTFESNNYRTYAIISSGELTINDATVTSNQGAIGISGGIATINGGSFLSTQHYGLYAYNSDVTVNGGTFTGERYSVDIYADTNSHITISESAVLTNNGTSGKGAIIFEQTVSAKDATEAQNALDNATEGTIISLTENVNYGTLYIRQSAVSSEVDVSDWAGNGNHERYREIKGISIIGANGATVDAIKFEAGTYTPNNLHSNSDTTSYLNSFIYVEDLRISGITFSGAEDAIVLTGHLGVNGITVENCVFNDDGDNKFFFKTGETTSVYTDRTTGNELFAQTVKNITISGCSINGASTAIELRESENVTIIGNTFKNVVARDILFAANSGNVYTGEIIIANNQSDGGKERFLRATSIDATVSITNNVITNWASSAGDTDVVKFSANTANTVINLSGNTWNGQTDDEAKANGLINLG